MFRLDSIELHIRLTMTPRCDVISLSWFYQTVGMLRLATHKHGSVSALPLCHLIFTDSGHDL